MFDPAGVEVSGLEGAVAHKAHYFLLDTSGCGPLHKGEVSVDIVHDKRSIMCAVEKLDTHSYRVSFMPKDNGKHRVRILSRFVIAADSEPQLNILVTLRCLESHGLEATFNTPL